jgi:primase-polymerase (primpol)-like protein
VITKETGILDVVPENIPAWLTSRRQWLVWVAEERGGSHKLEKVPYHAESGMRTDAYDSLSWTSFEDALACYRSSEGFYSGIGFSLASCDPHLLVDLDACRERESGRLKPWARRVLARVPHAYREVSVSGEGVHLVVVARLPANGYVLRRTQREIEGGGKVELYSERRWFAATGVRP